MGYENMSSIERRLYNQCVGLSYGGEIVPEDVDMKQIEIISFFDDYSKYVQECFVKGIKPQTKDEFKYIWNGIWNADLAKMNMGDNVYLATWGEGFVKTTIIEIIIKNDGEVSCRLLCNPEDTFCAGEIYKTDSNWKNNY